MPTANEVLQKLADTESEIKKMVFGEAGEIRISTECYSSYHWLPSLMRQFHLLYPNVELKIVMEATHYPLEKLLAGSLDVGLVTDILADDNIEYLELFQDEMVAVVSGMHEWTERKYIEAEDFAHENLFIHSLPMNTVTVHEMVLKPANVKPKKITVLPMTEACLEMVKAEMGTIVMAKWALKPYLALYNGHLKMVKIGKHGLKRTHFIATLKNKDKPDYFKHFIEFLQREVTTAWSI